MPSQFFLKGTQLTQLSEEYETCLENIGKATRTIHLKREEIPDLEKAFKEADARNKEATKAREKQSELAEYKRELAWAHVKTKEDVRSHTNHYHSHHSHPFLGNDETDRGSSKGTKTPSKNRTKYCGSRGLSLYEILCACSNTLFRPPSTPLPRK